MTDIKSYSNVDRETYQAITTIAREKKHLTKTQIIQKVESASKSDSHYTEQEKALVNDLKEELTDKNNTLEIRNAKIDPTSHKISFSLEVEEEKSLINKGINAIGKGFSKLDITVIKENKAIAKEEVMNNIDTLTNGIAVSYIDSKLGEGKLSRAVKGSVSGIGIASSTVLATGVDLIPDNLITIALSGASFVGKTSKAISSVSEGKLTTTAISGGKTTPKDFRFVNLTYKDEKKVAEAYKVIKESKTDVKAITYQ